MREGLVEIPRREIIQCIRDNDKRERSGTVGERKFDVSNSGNSFLDEALAVPVSVFEIIRFYSPNLSVFFFH